jgi:hypothetical protein
MASRRKNLSTGKRRFSENIDSSVTNTGVFCQSIERLKYHEMDDIGFPDKPGDIACLIGFWRAAKEKNLRGQQLSQELSLVSIDSERLDGCHAQLRVPGQYQTSRIFYEK